MWWENVFVEEVDFMCREISLTPSRVRAAPPSSPSPAAPAATPPPTSSSSSYWPDSTSASLLLRRVQVVSYYCRVRTQTQTGHQTPDSTQADQIKIKCTNKYHQILECCVTPPDIVLRIHFIHAIA